MQPTVVAFQWLMGGERLGRTRLSEFRVRHIDALQKAFTDVLGVLIHKLLAHAAALVAGASAPGSCGAGAADRRVSSSVGRSIQRLITSGNFCPKTPVSSSWPASRSGRRSSSVVPIWETSGERADGSTHAATARGCRGEANLIISVDQVTLALVDHTGNKGVGRTGTTSAQSQLQARHRRVRPQVRRRRPRERRHLPDRK